MVRQQVRAGFGDVASFGVGVFALGLTFGVLVVRAGLAWWWAPVFSTVVFAGSLEFLLLGLIVAGAPLATAAVTTLLVNGRHVFYALSYPLHRVRGRLARAYAMYAMTDESYAVATALPEGERTTARMLATSAGVQVTWLTGGLIGALAGGALSGIRGADFALLAMFVVLALDATRLADGPQVPLLAAACALVALVVAPGQMLLVGIALFTLLLAIRVGR